MQQTTNNITHNIMPEDKKEAQAMVKDCLFSHKIDLLNKIGEMAQDIAEADGDGDYAKANREVAIRKFDELIRTNKAIDFVYDVT